MDQDLQIFLLEDQGTTGTQGAQGTTGTTGDTGTQGTTGTQGATGSVTDAPAHDVTSFTATDGQTSFTVSYTAGQIDVYLNGIRLHEGEYTASNGTSVVLAVGASTGDILDVVETTLGVGAQGTTGAQGTQGAQGTLNLTPAHDVTSFTATEGSRQRLLYHIRQNSN